MLGPSLRIGKKFEYPLGMQIPGVCRSQGIFLIYFCNKLPFWQPFCLHSYFIYLLEAKCLQLDSNVIANNLWKKNWFETFFHFIQCFHFIIGLHLGRHVGYIEMLNDARVASLGFFKGNLCTTRINKEKTFKMKFQVLLKFAQILLDYSCTSTYMPVPLDHSCSMIPRLYQTIMSCHG